MTTLFTGNLSIPSGSRDFGPFAVSNGMTQATITFDGTVFPVGVTTITILFSFDGGVTFPGSASGTYNGPASSRFPNYRLSFDIVQQPTNVKINTNAPSAFTTATTVTSP